MGTPGVACDWVQAQARDAAADEGRIAVHKSSVVLPLSLTRARQKGRSRPSLIRREREISITVSRARGTMVTQWNFCHYYGCPWLLRSLGMTVRSLTMTPIEKNARRLGREPINLEGRSAGQSPLCPPDSDQIPQRREMTRRARTGREQVRQSLSTNDMVNERQPLVHVGEPPLGQSLNEHPEIPT